jgi:hypothetical protein
MKTRLGFVSNSSSSSFIIIDAKNGYDKIETEELNNALGQNDFGWEIDDYKSIHSRINFAYLQALYHDFEKQEDLIKMIEEVIKDNSNVKEIKWGINLDNSYIDHQSNASEGKNIEMFESKQMMKDFIFGKDSYIHTDNDNHL